MWLSQGSPVGSPASVPVGSIRAQCREVGSTKKATFSADRPAKGSSTEQGIEVKSNIFVLRRLNELSVLFPKAGISPYAHLSLYLHCKKESRSSNVLPTGPVLFLQCSIFGIKPTWEMIYHQEFHINSLGTWAYNKPCLWLLEWGGHRRSDGNWSAWTTFLPHFWDSAAALAALPWHCLDLAILSQLCVSTPGICCWFFCFFFFLSELTNKSYLSITLQNLTLNRSFWSILPIYVVLPYWHNPH